MAHRLPAAGFVLAGALASSACGPLTAPHSSAEAAPAHGAATGTSPTLAQLEELPVRSPSSLADYSRESFGPTWSDEGTVGLSRNHCPTRQDILARDLAEAVRAKDHCTVISGVLHDRYTGKTIRFQRGPRTSLAVQIDHIVPLALAWQSGARKLSAGQRLNLANDPENLVASDGPTNAGKGAKDASMWLPPRGDAHCWYASAQVRVKAKYRLSVSSAEKTAIRTALQSCPASGQDKVGAAR
ncbi:HNH endonuclease family protein [Streptomyces sp. MZ04]|uniref:HNH endonuclease family protein n=1 Tax=Streptomyces sp. MZ04 TaxID=2559236 RepID=UPI00107E9096|nr:HNH endonuclease family protein [Streptomyces sp. MZ04]TGB15507.1 HNH endonuclease [Streptomyces sp. MZ04]